MSVKKYTLKNVKEHIESFQYKLLSTDGYKNSHSKISVCCPQNHLYEVRFCSFKSGQRCQKCWYAGLGARLRLEYEDVKDYVESRGYELLSTEYVRSEDKIQLKCSSGHVFYATFDNFKYNESGCSECSGKYTYSYKFVKDFVERIDGYKLLSNTYIKNSVKIKIQCPRNHVYETKFGGFKNCGYRCQDCKNIDVFKSTSKRQNYTLPSGKIVEYQGYEHFALDMLLQIYEENEVEIHPNLIIYYTQGEKSRKHFPDFFIPSENLVIEVKSTWTYSSMETINKLKKEAAINSGYNYEFWIISPKGEILDVL